MAAREKAGAGGGLQFHFSARLSSRRPAKFWLGSVFPYGFVFLRNRPPQTPSGDFPPGFKCTFAPAGRGYICWRSDAGGYPGATAVGDPGRFKTSPQAGLLVGGKTVGDG